jgi:hypothetical protein
MAAGPSPRRFPSLVTGVLAGSSGLLLACSAVLGIHDIQPPVEAGAGLDGASDAPQLADGPAPDGPGDAGQADTSRPDGGDAGDGASCVAVTTQPFPRVGGPGCPTEASSCYPHDLTSWTPQWSAPRGPKEGACSGQQIDDYYAACRGPSWSQPLCSGFGAAPQNSTCMACMETVVGAGRWGAVIIDGQQNWINVPGCIVLAEPCNQPCAEAMTAEVQCYTDACGPACVGQSYPTVNACETDSVNACTTCSAFPSGANCFLQLTGTAHPAYTLCGIDQPGTQGEFTAIASMICGS